MNIKHLLDKAFSEALSKLAGSEAPGIVKQAQREEFGHYQANGVMGAAKKLKTNPRELAEKLIDDIGLKDTCTTEIAGPGFVNIHLTNDFVAQQLNRVIKDPSLGIPPTEASKIVVDYSGPNLAKEMHIGHLRSTAIGDTLVRILEFIGHDVVRVNHVGDWGAQFGSLLAYMDQLRQAGESLSTELKDLEKFYQAASTLFKSDENFAKTARGYVVRLQSGDNECLSLWNQFIEESIRHSQVVYEKFNITLSIDDIRAESAYNDVLPIVVQELDKQKLLVESDGAMCVFLDEFRGKGDKPLPAIVQKSDGGYPYMATDLAATRYRTQELDADKVLYVVGGEQQLHLRQVFAVAKAAGYIREDQEFLHLPFGMVLKEDGTRFKTRDGADVKLIEVLDEAINRAFIVVSEKNPALSESDRREVARVVGIGAVKYAELSKNRITDYIFDWDTMLAFEGNTAPYLQYTYTRIRSIFRRAGIDNLKGDIALGENAELRLGVKLLQFPETIESTLDDYQANVLCNYLYELCGFFNTFYEQCPVLVAEEPNKTSRLLLCELTARTLRQGLGLLGIETVEQM
jgi:arginyl-tRNA synthetase